MGAFVVIDRDKGGHYWIGKSRISGFKIMSCTRSDITRDDWAEVDPSQEAWKRVEQSALANAEAAWMSLAPRLAPLTATRKSDVFQEYIINNFCHWFMHGYAAAQETK